MKTYSKITLIIAFTLILTNVMAQKTKNYALYSLEETRFLCVSSDEKSVFCLEENNTVIVQRELLTGKVLKTLKPKLPNTFFGHAQATEKEIFISTHKDVEGKRVGSFDGIYSIDLKNGKTKKVFMPEKSQNELAFMYLSGELLIFSNYSREIASVYSYNFNKKKLKEIKMEKRYHVLFFAKEKNGLVFIQQAGGAAVEEVVEEAVEEVVEEAVEEIVEEVVEEAVEEEQLDDLMFCDFSNSNKIIRIGAYQSDAVYSSDPDECKYPYAVIENAEYEWFTESRKRNSYPNRITKLADNTELLTAYQKLDAFETISSVYLVNDEIFIGFNLWTSQVKVYNIKNPQTVKKSNLTKEQTALIDGFINERFSYIKTAIDSAVLAEVFDAKFYTITQKVLDNWGSSSSKYMAREFQGDFKSLKIQTDLTSLVKKDFKLNEKSASLFEKALDALYPLNVFDEKKKEHFKQDGKWYFVRGESFDVKEAICVEIDSENKITKINKKKDIK